jgi:hypothetical protein
MTIRRHILIGTALGLALATGTACSSSTSGHGDSAETAGPSAVLSSTAAGGAANPVSGAATSAVTTPATSASSATTAAQPAPRVETSTGTAVTGTGGGTTVSTIPSIDSMTVTYSHTCVQGNASSVSPVLSWRVSNASGISLSVDDPGEIGAYGTYGKSGSISPTSVGCSAAPGTVITHYFDIWTRGGTGPQAHRQITVTITIVPAPGTSSSPAS